jgi:hypothetical protein
MAQGPKLTVVLQLAVVAMVLGACGSDSGGAEQQSGAAGTAGNACYANGTCNTGLSCSAGTCVVAATGAGEHDASSSAADSATTPSTDAGCTGDCGDSAGSNDTGCTDACTAGSTQCVSERIQTCRKDPSSGCAAWDEGAPCPVGEECAEGACVKAAACIDGQARCQGESSLAYCDAGQWTDVSCEAVCSESPDFDRFVSCGRNEETGEDICFCCKDECVFGAAECVGNSSRICVVDPGLGCAAWSPATDCGPSGVCAAATGRCTGTGGCSGDGDCAADSICVAAKCTVAHGREYTVKILSAIVKERNSDGVTWDLGGSLPDPYAVMAINDSAVISTTPSENTTTPSWSGATAKVVLRNDHKVSFGVLEYDNLSNPEFIGGMEFISGIPAYYIRAGGFTFRPAEPNFPANYPLEELVVVIER